MIVTWNPTPPPADPWAWLTDSAITEAAWYEARQTAVLDEVLYAVDIVRNRETGNPESDDAGRPRIKLKRFDIDVQGFATIVQRHGEASLTRKALDHVYDRLRQQTLAFD